ncbi:MAG: PspC domain-containing protein [Saprospiraceae bacterium]|jgi:phage shock protein C
MERIQTIIHRSAFGVCNMLGRAMGISSSTVRLYFIYLSFVALGSPLLLYLFLAFWLNIRKHFRPKNDVIWE